MIGAIIGDIVGSCFEFNNHKSKEFELFNVDCEVTDDSITNKIVNPIINHDKNSDYYSMIESMTIRYMQEIGRKYPNCGYGGMFYHWVFSSNPKPYNSFGNGAAMRISPVGFVARTEDEVCKLSKVITSTTHNHDEGIKGAEATAVAIFMARRQETVPQAITAFLESNSFEDAIRTVISIGGDSDTLAAITGSIAEAYYGVPEQIKEKALIYLDTDLRLIYDEWCKTL